MSNNRDQTEFWNSQTSWIDQQELMDNCLAPALDAVMALADLQPGQRVVDIGCGTGSSLLAAQNAVGPNGQVHGLDVSAPFVDLARSRTQDGGSVTVSVADVQEDTLPGPFDIAISRFGVMFFDDTPKAFRNISSALVPGARLAMAAWAAPRLNPYFVAAAAAARDVYPDIPKTDPNLPGPFAFADATRVEQDLAAAGLQDISVEPHRCFLTAGDTLSDCVELVCAIGPIASAVANYDPDTATVAKLKDAAIRRFAPFETEDGMRIPAVLNMISARTGQLGEG